MEGGGVSFGAFSIEAFEGSLFWQGNCLLGIQSKSCYDFRQYCYATIDRGDRSCHAKSYHAQASAATRLRSNGLIVLTATGRGVANCTGDIKIGNVRATHPLHGKGMESVPLLEG